jgi:hypothetical protein
VQQLPETQRTALLLREIDALSYEQIAVAMETTVPSVKSLLVRARISLAEAAEARKLSCAEVRLELGEVAEGLVKLSVPARRHVRDCERCRFFRKQLKHNNHALAAILPVSPLLLAKKLLLTKLGSTASAGSAHMAGGAGATVGAGAGTAAGAGAGGGAGVAGGVLTAGTGAIATKAVAGLAAAAIVTAGAVAADHSSSHKRVSPAGVASSHALRDSSAPPVVIGEHAQPLSSTTAARVAGGGLATRRASYNRLPATSQPAAKNPAVASRRRTREMHAAIIAPAAVPGALKPPATQLKQVTSETTQLPAAATDPATTANTTGGTASPATTTTSASSTPTPPPPSPPPSAASEPASAQSTETPAPPPDEPPATESSVSPAPQTGPSGKAGATSPPAPVEAGAEAPGHSGPRPSDPPRGS